MQAERAVVVESTISEKRAKRSESTNSERFSERTNTAERANHVESTTI